MKLLDSLPAVTRSPILGAIPVIFTFSLLLTFAAAGSGTLPGDIALSRWIQHLGLPGASTIEWLGFWLGSLPGIIIGTGIVAFVLFLVRHFLEAFLVLSIALARVLNPLLKLVIESPRPTTENVRITEFASNYGFPSGHVMGVVLLYGGVIYMAQVLIRRRWLRLLIQGLSIAAILVTSFGRIHSGAHWPSDVLGGYLWGLLFLLLLVAAYRELRGRQPHPSATSRKRAGGQP